MVRYISFTAPSTSALSRLCVITHKRDKSHVEGGVKLAYQRIYAPLRNRTFYSLEELNEAIIIELERHNHTPMQRKRYSRFECFIDNEKSTLLPVTASPFVIKKTSTRKVGHNYHFRLHDDKHEYSVPHQYIGKTLTAVYDTETVEIYDGHDRLVTYNRNPRPNAYTTLPEHMPPAHQAYHDQKGWDSQYFLNEAGKIGPNTRTYIQGILKSRIIEQQAYNACKGLLREAAKTHIGNDRMEAACTRALVGTGFSYKTIINILEKNLDKQPLPGKHNDDALPSHDNIRGPQDFI